MGMYKDIEGALGPDEFNYAYSISLRHHYMFVENAKSASTTLKTILGGWNFRTRDSGSILSTITSTMSTPMFSAVLS